MHFLSLAHVSNSVEKLLTAIILQMRRLGSKGEEKKGGKGEERVKMERSEKKIAPMVISRSRRRL